MKGWKTYGRKRLGIGEEKGWRQCVMWIFKK